MAELVQKKEKREKKQGTGVLLWCEYRDPRSEGSMEQIIPQGREQGITHHAWWILTSNPACSKNEPKQNADLCKASVFLSEK